MSFTFKPATRENVGLLIGLIGPSGGGKTYTALELASGIANGKPFAVIDTEARRALHYADRFKFEHGELGAPFRPGAYLEAIRAADAAGYPVIVVDSMSHEHNGDGGLLDWHEEEWAKKNHKEAHKLLSWVKPKMAHKKMVQSLLQIRAHLILCFRAEEKTKMVKENGKMKPINIGWQPLCEKNLPYELTASMLLLPEQPGVPVPIKIQEQHLHLFPKDRKITAKSGEEIRKWAEGGKAKTTKEPPPKEESEPFDNEPANDPEDVHYWLDKIRAANLVNELRAVGADIKEIGIAGESRAILKQAYEDRLTELREG
jgi:hypothetical protein